ncbi:MAG TPA: hypothetical protein VIN09_13485 [Chloroflexota bacterium]
MGGSQNLSSRWGHGVGLARERSPLEQLFLARLTRLLRMRRRFAGRVSSRDWSMKLLNWAIYSTLYDYLDVTEGAVEGQRR